MLETMSKSRGIEHSMSMINFQSANPAPLAPLSPQATSPTNDSAGPGFPLSSIQETTAAGMGIRSASMPNFGATGRNFSSMMLSQYFDNIGTNSGDGNPDDDDFGLFIEEEGIEF